MLVVNGKVLIEMKTNVILNGKYKGYKLKFDDENNSIKLINKAEIIDLKGRVKSVYIKGKEVYKKDEMLDYYYFEIIENQEKIKCLINFDMYLRLIVYGMQVPTSCLGIWKFFKYIILFCRKMSYNVNK